jgi:hypothetical protein
VVVGVVATLMLVMMHMVVVVEASMGDADLPGLLAQIAVFKRRFGLVVSGVSPGVTALGAQGLQSLRNFAVFDHLYFSGDPAWLVADGLTSARRTGHAKHLFVSAQALLSDPVPSLRVLVELLGAPYDALWVPGLSALYCDQPSLDTLIRPRAAESWSSWADRAWAELRTRAKTPYELGAQWAFKPTVAQALPEPAAQSLELYVSRTGLGRFGGWSRLKQQPIRFGQRALDEFGLVVALDNEAQEFALSPEPEPGLASLCGWALLPALPEGGQGYLLDVVPAPVWEDNAEDAASAREMRILVRMFAVGDFACGELDEATFIDREFAEVLVGAGRGDFDEGEAVDKKRGQWVSADGKIEDRALRGSAPESVVGDLHFAHGICRRAHEVNVNDDG